VGGEEEGRGGGKGGRPGEMEREMGESVLHLRWVVQLWGLEAGGEGGSGMGVWIRYESRGDGVCRNGGTMRGSGLRARELVGERKDVVDVIRNYEEGKKIVGRMGDGGGGKVTSSLVLLRASRSFPLLPSAADCGCAIL